MKLIVFVVACATLLSACSDPASAAYASSSTTTDSTLGTTTLLAPTALTATTYACGMRLAWTNPHAFTPTEWKIQRYVTVGLIVSGSVQTVSGDQLTYNDSFGMGVGIGYSWTLWAVQGTNWTSPTATVAKVVISICL